MIFGHRLGGSVFLLEQPFGCRRQAAALYPRPITRLGAISFDGLSGSVGCLIRNLSATGALLVVGKADIPESFDLLVRDDGGHKKCRVVWRSGDRIGVMFDEPGSSV